MMMISHSTGGLVLLKTSGEFVFFALVTVWKGVSTPFAAALV